MDYIPFAHHVTAIVGFALPPPPQESSTRSLVSLVSDLALSPLSLLVWVIEGWVDGKLKVNIYKKLT